MNYYIDSIEQQGRQKKDKQVAPPFKMFPHLPGEGC